MHFEIGDLIVGFGGDFIRYMRCSPHLPMRMRVGAPHHTTLILENLHPGVVLRQCFGLFGPDIDDSRNFIAFELRQRLPVIRRKADHPASARSALGPEQSFIFGSSRIPLRQQRREIVIEHVNAGIFGIYGAIRAFISGT